MSYCTYLTVYDGNKLPPFYIGSARLDKIAKGYHGSVRSKAYRPIWTQELIDNPHLFRTQPLTIHDTFKEAVKREQSFQRPLKVITNPLYINKAIGLHCANPMTKETRQKIRVAATGKRHTKKTIEQIRQHHSTPEYIASVKQLHTGRKRPPETIKRITKARRSLEHIEMIKRIHTGKVVSLKTRENIRQAALRRWAKWRDKKAQST